MILSAIIALATAASYVSAGLCDGQSDGTIVCPTLNANTFALCYQGAATDYTKTQPCAPGLVCCASQQNCVYDGQCADTVGAPPLVLNLNAGVGGAAATSGSGSGNAGTGSGSGTGNGGATAAAAASPAASPAAAQVSPAGSGSGTANNGAGGYNPNPPVIAPGPNFNSTTACQGKPDNYWSCANRDQFTFCSAQMLYNPALRGSFVAKVLSVVNTLELAPMPHPTGPQPRQKTKTTVKVPPITVLCAQVKVNLLTV
ncbi:UNVERIFIED_CONTAM: hypothetical protein HDU68_003461 [Siphonaria sp. JEL0065]|nr:hypothetical protein HDU68_003461 [Siphonaria sp. JEL0065]